MGAEFLTAKEQYNIKAESTEAILGLLQLINELEPPKTAFIDIRYKQAVALMNSYVRQNNQFKKDNNLV